MKHIDGVMVNMLAYIGGDHGPSSGRIKPTICICCFFARSRRGRVRMVVGFATTYVISTYHTNVVSSNPAQARCTRYNAMR